MRELPLLEDCLPADLPLSVQAWIDPAQELPHGVSFYHSHQPPSPLLNGLAAAGLGGFGLLMLATMVMRLWMGTLTVGHGVVFGVSVPLFLLAAVFMSWRAVRAFRLRQVRKQGRLCTGYFVSESAFLDFDGTRAWLVPHRLVLRVRNRPRPSQGGAEHALIYRRGEETVRRRLEGVSLLPSGLNAWHTRRSLPSGVGWQRGTCRAAAAPQTPLLADVDVRAEAQRLREQAEARAETRAASPSTRPPPLAPE